MQLPLSLRLNSNFSWQISTIDLLPGDQLFQIGGPTTVRGYPTNSVSGDKCYLANIELHRDLSALTKGLDTFVFVDHGAVFSTNPGTRTATSGGVGLQWSPRPETTVELTDARPFHELVSTQLTYEIYGRLVWRPKL